MIAAAVVLGASSWASATIPDADTGAIHGCIDGRTGALRVIDPSTGASCRPSEQAITWNERPGDVHELQYDGEAPTGSNAVHPSLIALPYRLPDGRTVAYDAQGDPFPTFFFQTGSIVSFHEDRSLAFEAVDPTTDPVERRFVGTSGGTVTLVAEFTADEPLTPGGAPAPSLGPYLDALEHKTIPQSTFGAEPTLLGPPNLFFQWGPPFVGVSMTAVITELHVVHTEMTHDGLITGARVTMTLADVGSEPLLTNSFVASTRVLLADGTTRPIGDVRIGDMVLAADPLTGERGPRRVVDVVVGGATADVVDVEVAGQVVTATDGHPFWVQDELRWVDAAALDAGDRLAVAAGGTVEVDAVRDGGGADRVHNLVVAGADGFFVAVGDDAVLVRDGA